jgi:hypothetical protein
MWICDYVWTLTRMRGLKAGVAAKVFISYIASE